MSFKAVRLQHSLLLLEYCSLGGPQGIITFLELDSQVLFMQPKFPLPGLALLSAFLCA